PAAACRVACGQWCPGPGLGPVSCRTSSCCVLRLYRPHADEVIPVGPRQLALEAVLSCAALDVQGAVIVPHLQRPVSDAASEVAVADNSVSGTELREPRPLAPVSAVRAHAVSLSVPAPLSTKCAMVRS